MSNSNNCVNSNMDPKELGNKILSIAAKVSVNNQYMMELGLKLLDNKGDQTENIHLARKLIQESIENLNTFYSIANQPDNISFIAENSGESEGRLFSFMLNG